MSVCDIHMHMYFLSKTYIINEINQIIFKNLLKKKKIQDWSDSKIE